MRCLFRLCFVIPLLVPSANLAQDVVSAASGFWDDPQTWQAGIVPSALSSDQITIMAGHEVVMRDGREVDQLFIADGGVLRIDLAGICLLRDGPGVDLVIAGQVDVDGRELPFLPRSRFASTGPRGRAPPASKPPPPARTAGCAFPGAWTTRGASTAVGGCRALRDVP